MVKEMGRRRRRATEKSIQCRSTHLELNASSSKTNSFDICSTRYSLMAFKLDPWSHPTWSATTAVDHALSLFSAVFVFAAEPCERAGESVSFT